MGKHKHRRRDSMDGYGQAQGMNNGYMNQQGNPMMNQMGGQMGNPIQGQMNGGMGGQMNPNMNNMMGNQQPNMGMNQPNMNMNMNNPSNPFGGGGINNILQLLSTLGLGDPSQMAGLSQLLGGSGTGTGQAPDIFSMINSLLNMGGQPVGTSQQNTQGGGSNSTIEELLSRISPDDIAELQRVINSMQQNQGGQQDNGQTQEDIQVEDILSNLDFNSILNNLNNYDVDLSNVDVDNLEANSEDIKTVAEEDILEENVIKGERELTIDEYKKLVSILVRLIDPNKIKLLQKIVDDYDKDKKQ